MAFLGHPQYSKLKVYQNDAAYFTDEYLIQNYVILKCEFTFKQQIKYPSIPCYVDETTTIYPLNGVALLTGYEYVLARNQGCSLKINECFVIQTETVKPIEKSLLKQKLTSQGLLDVDLEQQLLIESTTNKPFYGVIKDLQTLRREHPKKSLKNLLYKEMSNSIYGNVVMGISNKRVFDIKTNSMVNLTANELSNPIIGSHITSMVRTVIGETIHNINKLGGKVVSVTTDGFITNIDNLEHRLNDLPRRDTYFLRLYQKIRKHLEFPQEAYELKNEGIGLAT
jgi:hypothetical protein